MYAAAGGASLASRQARQKQRQKKTTEQRAQQLKAQKVDFSKTPQDRQFHNYTTDPPLPKGISRIERAAALKPPVQPHERRHSTSNYHLKDHHTSRARIRESPSISIPVVPNHRQQPLTPCTLVQQQEKHDRLHHESSSSLHGQLPQILIPEGDDKMERRCSFVRQVEEMEKYPEGGTGVLDRCNHICNFELKDRPTWENHTSYYSEFDKDVFGSLDYPFSECSQGRAAWQERERGRRCSLSEEARQHRIKQSEAHHRWMKRNRIHDSTYGTGSEEDDFFSVYHQSAAANALLYVGLGTTAIGSVIFFVGTGEKGFKTLELRMIGPTLIACGLICCLIRVLLCACPSTCLRSSRKKNRLKEQDGCAHAGSHYPLTGSRRGNDREYGQVEHTTLLNKTNRKKKVSIVPPNYSLPSTSTSEFKDLPCVATHQVKTEPVPMPVIPQINLPPDLSDEEQASGVRRDDSIIELQNLDLCYDEQSISSDGSDGVIVVETSRSGVSKLTRSREPANVSNPDEETCLSVVIERSDNSDSSDGIPQVGKIKEHGRSDDKQTHSGVVLSPLQLGQ